MPINHMLKNSSQGVRDRARVIFLELRRFEMKRTDSLFAAIMILQWIGSINVVIWLNGFRFFNQEGHLDTNLRAAIFFGGAISLFPSVWARLFPGQVATRHIIAVAQMLMSALIIHVTGGRMESHFHIFGSLAFLAFYRDPNVLITASLVTALEHYARGIMPTPFLDTMKEATWHWLEVAGWVVFEDIFLIVSCVHSRNDLEAISLRQANLEHINAGIEAEVKSRTQQLEDSALQLDAERARSLGSARMAALGEMAAGVAHEINNPVAAIQLTARELQELCNDENPLPELTREMATDIEKCVLRIAKIVNSLRSFTRESSNDPLELTPLNRIMEETVELCREKFKARNVILVVPPVPDTVMLKCRPSQVSQVLLNLLQNSLDAVDNLPGPWVRIGWGVVGTGIELSVSDSGTGVPASIRDKIFRPFYTTKGVGKGTGLGLSISKSIMEAHGGALHLRESSHTCFVLHFPENRHEQQAA